MSDQLKGPKQTRLVPTGVITAPAEQSDRITVSVIKRLCTANQINVYPISPK